MHHVQTTRSPVHDQLVAFLDSHLGVAYRDDVGPLFGEATLISDSPVFTAALAAETDAERSERKPPRT